MPVSDDEFAVTKADAERESRRFLNSVLGKQLAIEGVELEERYVKTNFKRLSRITSMAWNPSQDYNLTLMGKHLIEEGADNAHSGRRKVEARFNDYLNFCDGSMPTWHYWQEKEFNTSFVSKAAVDPMPMAETLSWYNASTHLKEPTQYGINKAKDYMRVVFDKFGKAMSGAKEIKIGDIMEWKGQMNWNRNSGHPFWMPISEERYMTVDWPNFRDSLMALTAAFTREELEELAMKSPANVPNANMLIYGMFMRPPDRVIHAASIYWKGPGAVATANLTPGLRDSRIAWKSIPELAEEFASALVDATVVVAEDIRKYDRSIPRALLEAAYEAYWESSCFTNMPEFRNIIGALLYLLTKDAKLQVSPTHYMWLRQGLPSGHPLTQFIGSVVHLAFYEWWADMYSWESTLEKVLSDDGISIHKGVSLEEMDKFIFGDGAATFESVGMELHPDKTKLCDPTNRVYVGQLMGNEVYHNEMTFFLKRNFQHVAATSFGNPAGVLDSLLQSERPVSDEFRETVDKYIVAEAEIKLGGKSRSTIYDIARCVDVIASSGIGNPLIDDYIAYVQESWPGFKRRGVRHLTDILDESWRKGTTTYAGGTLDSGIHRTPVVEALLDLEGGTKFWDEVAF